MTLAPWGQIPFCSSLRNNRQIQGQWGSQGSRPVPPTLICGFFQLLFLTQGSHRDTNGSLGTGGESREKSEVRMSRGRGLC